MGHTWTVHYESPSGTKSYVEIPAHEYSAENVAKAIQAESAEIEKVHDMGKP
jgi:ribosomal protein S6